MNISWEDLDRLLEEFPDVEERVYMFGEDTEDNNYSYLKKNKEAAIWLLENADLLLQVLVKYREEKELNDQYT
jgi:hypothetical protein